MAKTRPIEGTAKRLADSAGRFVRDYTDGMSSDGVRRLFHQETRDAWRALAEREGVRDEPSDGLRRFLFRSRVLFLGVSRRLSPARRLLFVASLGLTVVGLLADPVKIGAGKLVIDFSPFWFVLAVAGLALLLVLELVDRLQVRDELEVARELQRDLLPREIPPFDDWRFAHSYRTANTVGGDYYDVLPLPDGRLAIVVADASGHGMAAGLLMAIAHTTLRTALDLDPEPRAVATLMNRVLVRTGGRRAFLTLFYGLLDPVTGQFDWVGAGHPFPLHRRAGGEIVEIGEGALPLGLRGDVEPACGRLALEPGDRLLLVSDGIPEGICPDSAEAFGFQRLRQVMEAGGGAQEIHDRLRNRFDGFVAGGRLTDDQTILVVARQP